VQVRVRVCKDFTRRGSASCFFTWTEHLGTICIASVQTHQNPQPRSHPWNTWVIHRMVLPPGRGASPDLHALWGLLWEETGAQGPGLGFQPEPGGCFVWGSSLSVDLGNLGQGLPLFLPESASSSAIYSNWGHTTQDLCWLLSSFLPSRQTGIWVVQSVMR
jgi:hypothetical protein